jgi:Transcription elongation factor, N-terminal
LSLRRPASRIRRPAKLKDRKRKMDDDDAPRLRLDGKLYMTPTGLAQLREELTTLMNVERPRVVNVVSWAAANGDRSGERGLPVWQASPE